ncbi:DUF4058 family protein [Candidatus Entotheonella palauensis]|uniref:DUF4058 family protein n=1 Tax=Candidatus Entotheonella palauensis TaxID=93172 RepID=UPI000B8021D3|nr:DUF4058 family protein [Candidatus Entotheonella palauensis]
MALQDHFHPPLSLRRHWHAFHNAWATYIASDLNRLLPAGYFAEPHVQFGVEIDVAAFDETVVLQAPDEAGELPVWHPSAPTLTVPFPQATDTVEILLFQHVEGPVLVGAVELISPANKDRPSHCDAFVAKCETYLQQGAGLVIVDVVTARQANLHDALLARLAAVAPSGSEAGLYAVSYRTIKRDGQSRLDIWQETFAIGDALPTLPLWLRGALCLPVDLEAAYDRTCREHRIVTNGV